MRALIALIIFLNFANALLIPKTYSAQIIKINGNYITLSNPIGVNGTSGAVVRNMQDGSKIIVSYVKQINNNQAKIIDTNPLNAKSLAKFKTLADKKDIVIGGVLYEKIAVLAKNKQDFLNIQSTFAINSINPDIFLTYLATKNKSSYNLNDLNEFGKMFGVGIFIIQKDNSLEVIDTISKEVINKVKYNATKGEIKPFFNNLNN
jgi:pimeloyl-CoA synthetase